MFALGLGCLLGGAGCERRRDEPGVEPSARTSVASVSPTPPAPSVAPSTSPTPSVASSQGIPAPASDELVIVAGGDVNLARELGQEILKSPGRVTLFEGVEPLVGPADVFFVNLESQLSDQGGETQSPLNRLVFTGPPGGAAVLARSGVDLVSLANNHLWDYGKRAFFETLDHLDRAHVPYVGASREPERMYEPTVIERNGWSIAVFAVTQIWNQGAIEVHPGRHHVAWARYDRLHKKLAQARAKHDIVLFSYHGGSEYLEMPMTWTRELLRVVMRAGVDAVFGHHPHVPQGIGWHRERPVFYSLGNLVFRMHSEHPWTGTGLLARLTFRRDEPPAVEVCPVQIIGHEPRLLARDEEAQRAAIRQHLEHVSLYVGGSEIDDPGEHGCMRVHPPPRRRIRQSTQGK